MLPTDRKKYQAIQKQKYLAIQKQHQRESIKKKELISLTIIENNEQQTSTTTSEKCSSTDVIPTSNFSIQNKQHFSTTFLSSSSNISNNDNILQPNSSSLEIICSVDIDRDNCVADQISGSTDEISRNF
jgi:hypothetical protein